MIYIYIYTYIQENRNREILLQDPMPFQAYIFQKHVCFRKVLSATGSQAMTSLKALKAGFSSENKKRLRQDRRPLKANKMINTHTHTLIYKHVKTHITHISTSTKQNKRLQNTCNIHANLYTCIITIIIIQSFVKDVWLHRSYIF